MSTISGHVQEQVETGPRCQDEAEAETQAQNDTERGRDRQRNRRSRTTRGEGYRISGWRSGAEAGPRVGTRDDRVQHGEMVWMTNS